MTINLTVNGVVYPFPEPDDENWGQNVTDWAQAVTGGMLQKAGGNFSLTADANFGATYGLVSTYFKSRQSNISTAGALRLAHGDVIGWRDNANAANLPLGVDSSDRLTFNGTPIQNSLSVLDTSTIDLTFSADTLSAAIISGSITNALINASAAIARTKLASGTASHVLINDGSGVMSSEAQLAITRGGTGQSTKTEAFDALSPTTTKGDLIAFNGTDNVRVAVGTNGQVLTADSGQASGLTWSSPLVNPMDGVGQMIYGGAAGAPTKLAVGSANQMLQANGVAAPTWNFIVNANIDNAAAIAYSKLALTGSIVNADISASAAIAYSKLNLTGNIVNADVSASAAIAYSKLNLSGSIVNADVSASAAIAYSKLALTGSIVNADISNSAAIAYTKLALTGSIVNADISNSAAIVYSKLSLTDSIVNADINSAAAIAYSKLNLANSIVNADVNATAAIAYSKLNLSGSILNADINASAAIAYSKLAALTASRALTSNASGVVTVSAVTSTELGYLSGVTTPTGSGALVLATGPTISSPILVTPTLGVATATSINKITLTAPATGATLTIIDGTTVTGPAASGTMMTLGNAETVSGVKSFNDGCIKLNGSSSGSGTLKAPAAASTYTWTLPAATDTLAALALAQTLQAKTLTTCAGITFTAGAALDWAAGNATIGASIGANTLTIGGASSFVSIPGAIGASGYATNNNMAGPLTVGMTGVAQSSFQTNVSTIGTEVLDLGKGSAQNTDSDVYVRFRYGASATSAGTAQGGIRSNSTHTAYEFFYSSDRKWKTNIEPWTGDAWGTLCRLPIREYATRNSPDRRVVGVIAQEVQEVVPQMVTYDEEMDGLTVGYSSLYPYFIKSFQQVYDAFASLKKEIEAIKQRLPA